MKKSELKSKVLQLTLAATAAFQAALNGDAASKLTDKEKAIFDYLDTNAFGCHSAQVNELVGLLGYPAVTEAYRAKNNKAQAPLWVMFFEADSYSKEMKLNRCWLTFAAYSGCDRCLLRGDCGDNTTCAWSKSYVLATPEQITTIINGWSDENLLSHLRTRMSVEEFSALFFDAEPTPAVAV